MLFRIASTTIIHLDPILIFCLFKFVCLYNIRMAVYKNLYNIRMSFHPLELLYKYSVSCYISVKDYYRLHQTFTMLSRLDTVKYLDFKVTKKK
jgi:hypothetical protein